MSFPLPNCHSRLPGPPTILTLSKHFFVKWRDVYKDRATVANRQAVVCIEIMVEW
jgi:hypothetical protein